MLRRLRSSEPFSRAGLAVAILALASASAVACFAAPGAFAAGEAEYQLIRSFGHDGTASTGFGHVESIAIDRGLGLVYVLDGEAEALFKFDLKGNPVPFGGSSPEISGNELSGLHLEGPVFEGKKNGGETWTAVNPVTHTVYVSAESKPFPVTGRAGRKLLAFKPNGEPSLFTAGPGVGTNTLPIPQGIIGLTVDRVGDLYVSRETVASSNGIHQEEGHISVFASSGAELLNRIHAPEASISYLSRDLAVAENGNVKFRSPGEGIAEITPSTFPVTGTTTYTFVGNFNGGGGTAAAIELDPLSGNLYQLIRLPAGRVELYNPERQSIGSFAGAGEDGELEEPDDIAVDSDTELVFVGENSPGGLFQVKVFEPKRCICPPAIASSGVSEVSADSAKLRARINSDTLDTTYWFEYGLEDCEVSACSKAPLAGAPIAAGFKAVGVTYPISGLLPETLYHYRVLAENELGTTEFPDKTFTTQGSGLGFKLADSRVWEMVSPANKHGGSIVLSAQGIIQAATDGNGLAYVSLGSIEADPEGNRALELSSVLAGRQPDGWSSTDITPPHTQLTRPRDAEYRLMTPDLSRALMEARDGTPLSPLATERTPYLRDNTDPAGYTPLLTAAEGYANVPPGTEFGSENPAYPIDLTGANADLSTVTLRSNVPLIEGAAVASLYSWSGGQVKAVSQLPADKGAAVVSGILGADLGSVRSAVSADGSRAFWGTGSYNGGGGINTTALYLHDTALEESVRLDLVQPGVKNAGPARPAFQIASADGTVVYFTDSRHLTNTASPEGRDLYRCEIPSGASLGGCAILTDLSAPLNGSGESAQVKDQALAASEDGLRIYFAAEGVLDTEPNKQGDTATKKEPNLYLWEEGEGVRFIATLAPEDGPDWGAGVGLKSGLAGLITADASPDGRYLAFMSDRSLTGYDNETAGGKAAEEAYRYDAASGELTCVSCNPTGGSPRAKLIGGNLKVEPAERWVGGWAAATLPEARTEDFGDSFYRPSTVLDNGRVFFNGYDSLVPADSNGGWDVYQYESTGTGSCDASSGDAATVRSGEGCVGLISSGTAEEEAGFLDASLTGDDVFFLSPSKLSVLDEDSVYDVYDARVNGVVAKLPDLAECQGEACQPAVSAPDDPTPASASFQGVGNPVGEATRVRCPKAERKVRRKGKVRCVPRKAPRKHRAHHKRRAAR